MGDDTNVSVWLLLVLKLSVTTMLRIILVAW